MVTCGVGKILQRGMYYSFAFLPKATLVIFGRSSDLFQLYRLPINRLANSGLLIKL